MNGVHHHFDGFLFRGPLGYSSGHLGNVGRISALLRRLKNHGQVFHPTIIAHRVTDRKPSSGSEVAAKTSISPKIVSLSEVITRVKK